MAGQSIDPIGEELDPLRYGATLELVRTAFAHVALPPIVTSTAVTGPMAAGLLRPRVVLPPDLAATIPVDALRDVLVHESAPRPPSRSLGGPPPTPDGEPVLAVPVGALPQQPTRPAAREVCDNHVLGAATLAAMLALSSP